MAGTTVKRGKGGQFAGSVGAGKTTVPTVSSAPRSRRASVAEYPDTPAVNDLYSRFIEMGSGRRSIDADQAEALEFYGVDTDTLPDDVDEDTIDAALDLLREAKTSGSGGYYSYGYDSDEAETLAATAYEALGYDADDAAERARELLADRDC